MNTGVLVLLGSLVVGGVSAPKAAPFERNTVGQNTKQPKRVATAADFVALEETIKASNNNVATSSGVGAYQFSLDKTSIPPVFAITITFPEMPDDVIKQLLQSMDQEMFDIQGQEICNSDVKEITDKGITYKMIYVDANGKQIVSQAYAHLDETQDTGKKIDYKTVSAGAEDEEGVSYVFDMGRCGQ